MLRTIAVCCLLVGVWSVRGVSEESPQPNRAALDIIASELQSNNRPSEPLPAPKTVTVTITPEPQTVAVVLPSQLLPQPVDPNQVPQVVQDDTPRVDPTEKPIPRRRYRFKSLEDWKARKAARLKEKEQIIDQIVQTARANGVKPHEALAIAQIESGFHPRVSRWEPKLHTYSLGLFQLLIPTAKAMGFVGKNRELLKPDVNIPMGIQYISMCYQVNKVSTLDLACCYQAGLYASEKVCHQNQMVRKYAAMLRGLKIRWRQWLEGNDISYYAQTNK
jgi:soluble lytic murein transglycosylase-like protein